MNISIDNIEVLENTSRLLVGDSIECKRLIFKDATGAGATKKLAGRKLCSLGDAKSHSVFINSKERLNQYTNLATLAASMAEINAQKQNSKQTKKDNNKKEMDDVIVESLEKLVKVQGNISKNSLTKKSYCINTFC